MSKPQPKRQTYRDFVKTSPNPNTRTEKKPGDLELTPTGVIRYGN